MFWFIIIVVRFSFQELNFGIGKNFLLDGGVLVQLVVKMKKFIQVSWGIRTSMGSLRSASLLPSSLTLGVLAAFGRRSAMKQCLFLVSLCESR